jgi:predicted dienelactone hydrolase
MGGRVSQPLDYPDAVDARRNRAVPFSVYQPPNNAVQQHAFPLVVFSHGAAGSRASHREEALKLVEHGFVVACCEHIDSNIDAVKALAEKEQGAFKDRFGAALHKVVCDRDAVLVTHAPHRLLIAAVN